MSYPASTLYPGMSGFYPGSGTLPGGGGTDPEPTGTLRWDIITDRHVEAGIDRGVLYPNGGVGVPWVGLTAVEEAGGEGAAEYYIDGRPFLFLPKAKEFTATLKAFTYPDEFSAIMGEVEIADGMYLDSQGVDSFGLSYRTKIADALRGENAAYKIHLVYNATVVPTAKAYGTIGDAINPVEFSWAIQAVPVAIAGHKATAHIIIDTRHMDDEHIAAIEELLYGTDDVVAAMPDPDAIFDMLSFGDGIIITDNGDGTWTAEGSYHNVHETGNGTFVIENVNGTIHGDGTYTISTTP